MEKNRIGLYVHLPWCLSKCPYCDFNSFKAPSKPPKDQYIDALKKDFLSQKDALDNKHIDSIFFGGGTPNVFETHYFKDLICFIKNNSQVSNDCEITMEANPGSAESLTLLPYLDTGINRISIGIQSFNNDSLQHLGRIHRSVEATECAKSLKDQNFNIDIMHSLPKQTAKMALDDLKQAIELNPKHLSWYELTMEPNTVFAITKPKIPDEDILDEIYSEGLKLIHSSDLHQYEVSAYAKKGYECRHNLHYWNFDDYVGIGAGSASKISHDQKVTRYNKIKSPQKYIENPVTKVFTKNIESKTLAFEFMLNRTRLISPISFQEFEDKTHQSIASYEDIFQNLIQDNLIEVQNKTFKISKIGRRFLNNIQEAFLP